MLEYKLTEKQLREGVKKCIENVQNLLDGVNLLLTNDKTQQYALGLYMFAVEEFGKALILTKCFDKKTQERYLVPKWIFGKEDNSIQNRTRKNNQNVNRSAHYKKLKEAFDNLPSACREISTGIKIGYPVKSIKTFRSTKEP